MEQVIVANNLHKKYGQITAVNGLSISVEKGEVLGFLGPNGAGKSTSINMFTGILKPTSGELTVLDYTISSENANLSEKIGYVPQNLVFYDHLTVYENLNLFAIAYGVDDRMNKINDILELLLIEDLQDLQAGKLSGGQKRRLNLAIGLLHTPQILFLDEPSAGMDPQSRNILWETIEKLAEIEGMTIILTTHLMETADRLADRVAIIDHGEIQVIDTPDNLKNRFGNGDIIDLLIQDNTSNTPKLVQMLESRFGSSNIRFNENKIRMKSSNGVNSIAEVMQIIDETIGKSNLIQISMHESTLEDVFIALTGRELRE
ncbi:MAG: ABC transporter ATP-binding protein [Candidatus Kariarchaeaceae archaeon]|jgi:ABC-2 type transport system ATP-binding protein